MIYNNAEMLEALTAPVRNIAFYADIYLDEEFVTSFTDYDNLISLTVERAGEDSKFFGFGICHKLNLKILDKDRSISISTANNIRLMYKHSPDSYLYYCTPRFYVTDVYRDENTNELSITGYDVIYKQAAAHTVDELGLESYNMEQFVEAIATMLGATGVSNLNFTFDSYLYPKGANFEGTESLRDALNAVAEATQSIYYMDYANYLCFRRLSNSSVVDFTIYKKDYIDLDTSENRRLSTITHATELGDNITATTGVSGTTQYIRNNPFWDLREDIATLVDNAITNVGGLTINQFQCEWRGIPDLQVGDKIALETKDGNLVYSYILNDTLTFDGTLKQETQWHYEVDESETEANATSIGDAIKQTFAKVDKVNKQIDLVASEATANSEKIAALQFNTSSIIASVSDIQQTTDEAITNINGDMETLTNRVNATMTAEDVTLEIQKELNNGVDKVTTSTGFTFNEEGLTVSKTDSEMKTTVTEDGMVVYRNEEAVLTANNVGVDAVNLSASTYLIIGKNSRFEDYADNRTGCFWVGG